MSSIPQDRRIRAPALSPDHVMCGIEEWAGVASRADKKRIALFHRGHLKLSSSSITRVKVYGGWHEADNPVASIDTGIKRPTTETQVNPRYYAAVYIVSEAACVCPLF
jgi:hypothetical protein